MIESFRSNVDGLLKANFSGMLAKAFRKDVKADSAELVAAATVEVELNNFFNELFRFVAFCRSICVTMVSALCHSLFKVL